MIDVSVSINTIIMCCDDSISNLNLGNGYVVKKVLFEDLPFIEKIIDGRSTLSTYYWESRLFDGDKMSFMCLEKSDTIKINSPQFEVGSTITYDNELCKSELSQYIETEMQYLEKQINLCRLFQSGNIGFKEVFFQFKNNGSIVNRSRYCEIRNTIDNRIFILPYEKSFELNSFLSDYSNKPYNLLKNCINKFSWGLEQLDIPTGFEQYTTALEMVFLPKNQQGKKQRLANRVSAMLYDNDFEIKQLHQKMLDFYRFRSNSLHEGDGSNITDSELKELEDIVRRTLVKCLKLCKTEISINPNVTWTEVKEKIIKNLISKVTQLQSSEVL